MTAVGRSARPYELSAMYYARWCPENWQSVSHLPHSNMAGQSPRPVKELADPRLSGQKARSRTGEGRTGVYMMVAEAIN